MGNSKVVIEKVFEVDSAVLWQALTNKDLMKQWYFDLSSFEAKVGFVFEFLGGKEDGEQYLHRCEITEVITHKKLIHTWKYVGYEGLSYLSFELIPEGKNTKLILIHSELDTFPADNPDLTVQNFETGWNHIIGMALVEFLKKK